MKFGYELDSPEYKPQFLEATCFADAVSKLEEEFDVSRMAGKRPDIPWVEIWRDYGVERKHMSFEDLKNVYKLHPDSSGHFKSQELCSALWNELCHSSDYIDSHSGKLLSAVPGFSAGMNLKDVFTWLDDHNPNGIRALIFGQPNTVLTEPVSIPCDYVSVWDGFGEISSSAKYNPVTNEVYDVEPAVLTEAELAECEILSGEYMQLLGSSFPLGQRSESDTWPVKNVDPILTISGMSVLHAKPPLSEQIDAAALRSINPTSDKGVPKREAEH